MKGYSGVYVVSQVIIWEGKPRRPAQKTRNDEPLIVTCYYEDLPKSFGLVLPAYKGMCTHKSHPSHEF